MNSIGGPNELNRSDSISPEIETEDPTNALLRADEMPPSEEVKEPEQNEEKKQARIETLKLVGKIALAVAVILVGVGVTAFGGPASIIGVGIIAIGVMGLFLTIEADAEKRKAIAEQQTKELADSTEKEKTNTEENLNKPGESEAKKSTDPFHENIVKEIYAREEVSDSDANESEEVWYQKAEKNIESFVAEEGSAPHGSPTASKLPPKDKEEIIDISSEELEQLSRTLSEIDEEEDEIAIEEYKEPLSPVQRRAVDDAIDFIREKEASSGSESLSDEEIIEQNRRSPNPLRGPDVDTGKGS